MTARKPRAHIYVDGGGMVTGTHDVALARKLIVAAHMDAVGFPKDPGDDPPGSVWARDRRKELAYASRMFRVRNARLETGRIVPTGRDNYDYVWFWRSGYELGKPGVTPAVVWLP